MAYEPQLWALALVKFCIRTCDNALSGVRQWLLKVPEVILPDKQVRCPWFSCCMLEPRSCRSCLHMHWWHLPPEVWSQARNQSFLREQKLLSLSFAFLLKWWLERTLCFLVCTSHLFRLSMSLSLLEAHLYVTGNTDHLFPPNHLWDVFRLELQ